MLRKQRLFQEGGPKTKQTKDEILRRSGELIHSYFSSGTLNQSWVQLEVRNLDLTKWYAMMGSMPGKTVERGCNI